MNENMAQANRNWAAGNTVGKRLMVTSEEIQKYLPLISRSGQTMTLREDLSSRLNKGRI